MIFSGKIIKKISSKFFGVEEFLMEEKAYGHQWW